MKTEWHPFGKEWEERYGLAIWWAVFGPLSAVSVIAMLVTLGRSERWCGIATACCAALAFGSEREGLHRRSRRKWMAVAAVIAVTWASLLVFILRHASQPAFRASLGWWDATRFGLGMLALLYATMEVALEGVRKTETREGHAYEGEAGSKAERQ